MCYKRVWWWVVTHLGVELDPVLEGLDAELAPPAHLWPRVPRRLAWLFRVASLPPRPVESLSFSPGHPPQLQQPSLFSPTSSTLDSRDGIFVSKQGAAHASSGTLCVNVRLKALTGRCTQSVFSRLRVALPEVRVSSASSFERKQEGFFWRERKWGSGETK